jgi:hypothetical protein
MSNIPRAITCQIRAIADHILKTESYLPATLRMIAAEMEDTRSVIEAEILRRDSLPPARQALSTGQPPEGGAA